MAGDGLVRPVNAPSTAPLAYGTQPGTTPAIIIANKVIVFGTGGGVFVYSGTPANGNPPIFWATSGTTDPYGNALPSTTGVASTGTFQAGNTIIIPSGEFTYSGTPAANNLLMSLAPANGTDSFGNHYVAGQWVYGATTALGFASGSQVLASLTGSQAAGWAIHTVLSNDGTNTFINGTTLQATLGGGTAILTTDAQGIVSVQGTSGLSGALPMIQVDISTNGPGNTAAATDITKAWSIPANDAAAGTTYTIKALLIATTGPTTIETLTIGADIAGTKTALATIGTAFNGGALNTVYAIPFELVMVVDAVSAGTPEVYISAPLGDTSANRLSTNSLNAQGFTHAASFAKASGGTFAAYAQWGGTGGAGQLAQTISSRLYREGP